MLLVVILQFLFIIQFQEINAIPCTYFHLAAISRISQFERHRTDVATVENRYLLPHDFAINYLDKAEFGSYLREIIYLFSPDYRRRINRIGSGRRPRKKAQHEFFNKTEAERRYRK